MEIFIEKCVLIDSLTICCMLILLALPAAIFQNTGTLFESCNYPKRVNSFSLLWTAYKNSWKITEMVNSPDPCQTWSSLIQVTAWSGNSALIFKVLDCCDVFEQTIERLAWAACAFFFFWANNSGIGLISLRGFFEQTIEDWPDQPARFFLSRQLRDWPDQPAL